MNVVEPPQKNELFVNSPSPFVINIHRTTIISYKLSIESDVELAITDFEGKIVKILKKGRLLPGYWGVSWDGTDSKGNYVGAGIYFYYLKTDNGIFSKKIRVIK